MGLIRLDAASLGEAMAVILDEVPPDPFHVLRRQTTSSSTSTPTPSSKKKTDDEEDAAGDEEEDRGRLTNREDARELCRSRPPDSATLRPRV